MKVFLIYFSIIMFQYQIIAQSPFNGLYVNDADEFICFHNDTVCFRISNNDAFGTFILGKGNFEAGKNNKFCILKSTHIISHTSTLDKHPRNDKELVITVLNADSIPLEFVKISISKIQDESSSIVCYSDKNGQLILNTEQIGLFSEGKVSIHVETIGFITEKILELKRGYSYVIQSVIPNKYPFTINENKKIRINIVSNNKIRIKIGGYLSSILNKSNENNSCSEFLFNLRK